MAKQPMKLSERLETLVRNACPGWHAAETIREAAELARRCEVSSSEDDARRYRAFFDAGLPITFLGQQYHTKAELDAAIDEAQRGEASK